MGGRALRYELFPLVFHEIPSFDLKRALNHGILPRLYIGENPSERWRAYVGNYLKEEVAAEALTRDLPAFNRDDPSSHVRHIHFTCPQWPFGRIPGIVSAKIRERKGAPMNTLTVINADLIRAALRETEEHVKETLKDLESNDMDHTAMADRIRLIEKSCRRLRRAA